MGRAFISRIYPKPQGEQCADWSKEWKLQVIDRVLMLLAKNEAWQSIDDIAERAHLPREETADIIHFLALNQFILLNKRKEAKIRRKTSKFLVEIQQEEMQSAR